MSAKTKKGFSFRDPKGRLDWRIVETVAAAQSNAAFDLDLLHSHREFPRDWDRAYRQGYRVVRVEMKSNGTNGAWRDYQRT